MSVEISISELVDLAAVDSGLFAKTFFPKTVRQEIPDFHEEMYSLLDGTDRYINFQVFRGGAKTTICRIFAAKRVAYTLSNTIVYVGKSAGHAERSVRWLRLQVEKNKFFTDTYGLQRGQKWTDQELQIVHGPTEASIWVLAMGITGSTRGINIDDYRPDLIIVDDVVDEENSATPEQRDKIEKLVHGALKNSLAPASENKFSKMAILQTPLDFDDISEQAKKDPQFKSAVFSCWTKETAELPLEYRESIWPARWPSEVLRQDRMAAQAKNKLSIFSREMECKLITPETSTFRQEWIRYFGEGEEEPEPPQHQMIIELVIDPVPPPSEVQIAKGLQGKDFEVLMVVGRYQGKFYCLEVSANRGHEPNWTISEFFRLCHRWRPRKVLVEQIAYQRTLKWLLAEAMKRAGKYYLIEDFPEKRAKIQKITDGLSGVLSNGQAYIRKSQTTLSNMIVHYPNVRHDDEIECFAVGITSLSRGGLPGGEDQQAQEDEIEALPGNYLGAP